MLKLRYDTPKVPYQQAVMGQIVAFMQDHAANERKVSQAALQLVAQHPTKIELVKALIDVAEEELLHFRQVTERLHAMGKTLWQDEPDPYMGKIWPLLRKGDFNEFLMDRLLAFAIVEARGCERFSLVADALAPGELKEFYTELVRSESRHHATYLRLAKHYFDAEQVDARLDELLDHEAEIVSRLPLRSALH